MKHFWSEIWLFIVKNATLLMALSVGMMGKIAIDIRIRGLSLQERWANVILAAIFGYMVAQYLNNHGMENKVSWMVPPSTLIGDSLISWVMSYSHNIFKFFAKKTFGMKDEDLKN